MINPNVTCGTGQHNTPITAEAAHCRVTRLEDGSQETKQYTSVSMVACVCIAGPVRRCRLAVWLNWTAMNAAEWLTCTGESIDVEDGGEGTKKKTSASMVAYMYRRGLMYKLQAMNWWKIIIHTLALLAVVIGSTPYTLSAPQAQISASM